MLPEPQTVVPGSLEGWNPALKASMLFFWLGNVYYSSEILESIERWFVTGRGCLGSRIACIFMKAQILTWAYKLLTSCVSTYAYPSVLEQGHYADRECHWEQVGRKEDLPGNVKIFSSPKETTKSSIPNVEYSGALSNKEADLYSVFQAWLLYAFSASFHLVKTHFNSILLAINILVQNVIPSS